jgi:DNA-binding XRE family transcriptional regulator
MPTKPEFREMLLNLYSAWIQEQGLPDTSISKTAFARCLGVSSSSLIDWMAGTYRASWKNVLLVCKNLELDFNKYFGYRKES